MTIDKQRMNQIIKEELHRALKQRGLNEGGPGEYYVGSDPVMRAQADFDRDEYLARQERDLALAARTARPRSRIGSAADHPMADFYRQQMADLEQFLETDAEENDHVDEAVDDTHEAQLDEGDPGDDAEYAAHLQQHGRFTTPENIPGTHAYKKRHGHHGHAPGGMSMPGMGGGGGGGYVSRRSEWGDPDLYGGPPRVDEARWAKLDESARGVVGRWNKLAGLMTEGRAVALNEFKWPWEDYEETPVTAKLETACAVLRNDMVSRAGGKPGFNPEALVVELVGDDSSSVGVMMRVWFKTGDFPVVGIGRPGVFSSEAELESTVEGIVRRGGIGVATVESGLVDNDPDGGMSTYGWKIRFYAA